MKVSVIIPTYNGAHKILNLIRALENQTHINFEVIVVIDGSTDNTEVLLNGCMSRLEIRLITKVNGGRAAARNTGAKYANGNLLLFLDDDMRPLYDCVEQHIYHHQRYNDSICVGAAIDDKEILSSDFQKFKTSLTSKWNTSLPKEGEPMNKNNLLLAAANCSIPVNVFKILNGFDERLSDGEDFELGTRALINGVPIYYSLQAQAYHDDPVTCWSYIRRQREYTKANQKLHEIKPEIIKNFKNTVAYNPSYLKKAVFSFFSNRYFIYSIDKLDIYPFILPKRLRYKLYDVVVCGLAKVFPGRKI